MPEPKTDEELLAEFRARMADYQSAHSARLAADDAVAAALADQATKVATEQAAKTAADAAGEALAVQIKSEEP